MFRRLFGERCAPYANLASVLGFVYLLWVERDWIARVIIHHPLRDATLVIGCSAVLMWRLNQAVRIVALQRDGIIAGTQSAHRHMPRITANADGALNEAMNDILFSYVTYYEERFGVNAGQTWEASLWLPCVDRDGKDYLYIAYGFGVSEKVKANYKMGAEAPYHIGMAWHAWTKGESFHSNNALKDSRFDNHHRTCDPDLKYRIRSIRCDVVKHGSRSYGVLVVDRDAPRTFNDNEAVFNVAYARLVGHVLHAAQEVKPLPPPARQFE